jgi:hypothetical protein
MLPRSASKNIHYYAESATDTVCCIGGSGIEGVLCELTLLYAYAVSVAIDICL